MFAAYVEKPNFDSPLSALIVGEHPELRVPEGWVRVKMSAASLNWHDIWTLRGMGAAAGRPEIFPMILGCDGIGTLDDGTRVAIYPIIGNTDWRDDETLDPERNVFTEQFHGSFADYMVVPRRNAVPLPQSLASVPAAVLGAAWLTAYRMMFTRVRLRPGQTVLVQGASGGVATALIQLGRAAGLRVWATGRSEEKRALAESLGAHRTFASNESLPEKVDAVFEPVGAATWKHSIHSVRPGGTVVICGVTTGDQPGAELASITFDQITVTGVFAGTRSEFRDLITFVDEYGLKPQVGRVLPITEAAEGMRMMWEGNVPGKIVFSFASS
jgi:NADPH:quinone reductase-like Zn-dependent oxidoreductase